MLSSFVMMPKRRELSSTNITVSGLSSLGEKKKQNKNKTQSSPKGISLFGSQPNFNLHIGISLIKSCCSIAKSCLTLCDPMDCSIPGSPVFHYLPEFAQTHVH